MTAIESTTIFTRCTPLMDALRDGIVLVDADGIVQCINKSARAMYQGGEPPLVGYPLSDFNAADWVEVKRVLTSGAALDAQRMILPVAEVLVTRVPLLAQGAVTGVLCTLHNLADSDAHIRHLPSHQQALRDVDALLALPDTGVVIVDAQGQIRLVNAVLEHWSGKGRDSLLGLPLEALGTTNPSDTTAADMPDAPEADPLGLVAALRQCLAETTPTIRFGVSVQGRSVCCVATLALVEGQCRFVLGRVQDCEATVRLLAPQASAPCGTETVPSLLTGTAMAAVEPDDEMALFKARSLGMVVKSRAMIQLVRKMDKVGQTESSVLLQGESGVGKSACAALIHKLSRRADAPFVVINCGAIPESLMESELFGYERGAFTGADPKGKVGRLESGHGGTVFMDEIGELPMSMQVKLLEALDRKSFLRVGGTRPIKVDIRIIAATNRALEDEVSRGNFRKDLYYRLKVIPLTIPPLRERPEDITAMAVEYLLQHNASQHAKKRLTPEVMDMLARHPFHGNMRELLNTLEWLVVMSEGDTLTPHELPMSFHTDMHAPTCAATIPPVSAVPGSRVSDPPFDAAPQPAWNLSGLSLKDAVQKVERHCIDQALVRHSTLFEAAQSLGVHPTTLWRKMTQLQMTDGAGK